MDVKTRARRATGFTLIELLVVVAGVVVLAAMLAPSTLTWVNEGRAIRAQGDAAGIAAAMNRFFYDTMHWPGQVEIVRSKGAIRYLTVGDPSVAQFPDVGVSLGVASATCASAPPGVTTLDPSELSPASSVNITDLLLRPPPAADYPNWKGPYLSTPVSGDPWGALFIINIVPLFCSETVTDDAPGGALGFAWILSGGPNQTLQTPFTAVRRGVDDVGLNLNKRLAQTSP